MEDHKSYDAQVFLSFLENVLKKYPMGNIVMILDNAKIHHAKLLTGFLLKNPRLHLEFLPPYSPDLNIIEELWGWMKATVINNVFFHTRDEIKAAVRSFLDYIDAIPLVVIDRLCI